MKMNDSYNRYQQNLFHELHSGTEDVFAIFHDWQFETDTGEAQIFAVDISSSLLTTLLQ